MASKTQSSSTAAEINRHYTQTDIESEIEKALGQSSLSLTAVTPSDLAALDELHIGGRTATLSLGRQAKLPNGSLVLDVGCGLGGPVRTLAAEFEYRVIGIDITERFCHLSRYFSNRVTPDMEIQFLCGDALRLPFYPAVFDAIWSQHCSMNISDKPGLFAEYHRVLKTGAQLLVHDVVAGSRSPILFPVPWASDQSLSFLDSESDLRTRLSTAGFTAIHWQDISSQALEWFALQRSRKTDRKQSLFNQKMVYGETLLTMVRNMIQNLEEDRMRVLEAILSRSMQS